MKTKKITKKPVLKKDTIANLKNTEIKGVYAGIGSTLKWTNCYICTIAFPCL